MTFNHMRQYLPKRCLHNFDKLNNIPEGFRDSEWGLTNLLGCFDICSTSQGKYYWWDILWSYFEYQEKYKRDFNYWISLMPCSARRKANKLLWSLERSTRRSIQQADCSHLAEAIVDVLQLSSWLEMPPYWIKMIEENDPKPYESKVIEESGIIDFSSYEGIFE